MGRKQPINPMAQLAVFSTIFHRGPMVFAKTLRQENTQQWVKLATAFYSLAHNDEKLWRELPASLCETDVGMICEEYLKTQDSKLIDKAGELLAGPQWFAALGRSL
jgi:hypothetical protein